MSLSFSDITPYSALYIDITQAYILRTLWNFFVHHDRDKLLNQIQNLVLRKPHRMLVTACIRTATDLLFQALDWEPGTELIVTCINIPNMITIVRYHGIIPVPVEIDFKNLGSTLEQIQKAYTPKTKGIMLSYIYGAKFDSNEIINWAKSKDLLIIEDSAEAFNGTDFTGNDLVDFTTYSFGNIKTLTSLGGSISILRNNEILYRKMQSIESKYPIIFAKRILKAEFAISILNYNLGNKLFRYPSMKVNFDYKELVVSMMRGFKMDQNFLETYRIRMPTPMLYLLAKRISEFNYQEFYLAQKKLTYGQNLLVSRGILVPGYQNENRAFWLFPIIVKNPQLVYTMLNQRGIDAYKGVTQLDIVESPVGSNYEYPSKTMDDFKNMLYLPLQKNVPLSVVQKICQEVIEVVELVDKIQPKL